MIFLLCTKRQINFNSKRASMFWAHRWSDEAVLCLFRPQGSLFLDTGIKLNCQHFSSHILRIPPGKGSRDFFHTSILITSLLHSCMYCLENLIIQLYLWIPSRCASLLLHSSWMSSPLVAFMGTLLNKRLPWPWLSQISPIPVMGFSENFVNSLLSIGPDYSNP